MKTLLIDLLVGIILITGTIFGINALNKARCYSRYAKYAPEYVGIVTGCMITVDEEYVPAGSLRMTL